MKLMRVTPTRLFLILTVMLCYITASGIWLVHFAPNLIGSSSEFEVVAGFFGVSVWLITSACLALSVIGLPATSRAPTEAFNIDDHIRLVADAERYRWLRDKVCIEDAENDLMVVRGDRYFDGAELDTEVDNAIRLARLQELHP